MSSCSTSDVGDVMEAVESLKGKQRASARRLAELVTPKGLCSLLHAMRRWYPNQTGWMAERILAHRDALVETGAMDLDLPRGAWRGFKVPRSDPMAQVRTGQVIDLAVTRNGGCSSWTAKREKANRFSGASKTHVGLVVELVSGADAVAFIAPPERSAKWFNALYESAIGSAFRETENEFAVRGAALRVRVVAVKR